MIASLRMVGTAIALAAPLLTYALAQASQETEVAARYAAQQAEIARLQGSSEPADQEALGEIYFRGIMTSSENPLRLRDLEAARAAYRRALDANPTSAESAVALAKLAIRAEDSELLAEIVPLLRAAMFAGEGEAAYVLVLAAKDELVTLRESLDSLMTSAAVLGSTSALTALPADAIANARTAGATVVEKLKAESRKDNEAAMYALFRLYRDGIFVEADEKAGDDWLVKAAEAGHEGAMKVLAGRLGAKGGEENLTSARDWLLRAANSGSIDAAIALGRDAAYEQLLGVDLDTGRLWLRRALEAGATGARAQLALLDLSAAFLPEHSASQRDELIDKALATLQDHPNALAEVADTARRRLPQGVLDDKLLPRLKAQAQKGHVAAGLAYNAWMQADGRPLPSDVARALSSSLGELVERNVAFARFMLANLSLEGRLGETGPTEAVAIRLLFRAADDGVGQAMLRLGQMYSAGEILPQDRVLAADWYERARKSGVVGAERELTHMLIASDRPEDRARGERRLRAAMEAGELDAATALVGLQGTRGGVEEDVVVRAEALTYGSAEGKLKLAKVLAATGRIAEMHRARRLIQPMMSRSSTIDASILDAEIVLDPKVAGDEVRAAIRTLEEAAGRGSAKAALVLSALYLKKAAYRRDQERGVELVRQVLAEDPSNEEALLLLAEAYIRGRGVTRDVEAGRAIVEGVMTADKNANPPSAAEWANWLLYTDQEQRDPSRAIEALQPLVRAGNATAKRALGLINLSGYGLEVDPDRALVLMAAAADAGDETAMTNLGHMLLNGYGVGRDIDAGLKWLTTAAEAGNAAANYDLSRIYALGTLGRVDERESLTWLRRAAELDHPAATYQLGLAYLHGTGLRQDAEEAARWFKQSELVGNQLAGRTLRQMGSGTLGEDRLPVLQ